LCSFVIFHPGVRYIIEIDFAALAIVSIATTEPEKLIAYVRFSSDVDVILLCFMVCTVHFDAVLLLTCATATVPL
jgi:hypothetical protein